MVLVRLEAAGRTGIGYTYADASTGAEARKLIEKMLQGRNAFEHGAILQAMFREVRNSGEVGVCAMAISTIDNSLWDLRARVLDVSLVNMLGAVRPAIPLYGSGGFTSCDDAQLSRQLGGWAERGFAMVKMKVGAHPADDTRRVDVARKAIGETTELFVDANGAYTVTQALELARRCAGRKMYRCHHTAARACISTCVVRRRGRFTWSSFTTMRASSGCSSTGSVSRRMV
jgi:L-alanine-DL-glutamate epimerase-like enolase superfamily enzyme